MTYEIELSHIAIKKMAKISKRELLSIQAKIEALSTDPRPTDLKKIRGDDNLYRIRVGNYRILYRIFDEKICIIIVNVGHRKDICKWL